MASAVTASERGSLLGRIARPDAYRREPDMAIDFDLDADLVMLVQEVSGEPDRAAAVTRALREFIDRRQGDLVLDLFPGLEWEGGPDDWETLMG